MTPSYSEIAKALDMLACSAYQCGHTDAPSFVVPDTDKIYGYKQVMEAIESALKSVAGAERERCAKIASDYLFKEENPDCAEIERIIRAGGTE